jgi:hypothetical protein
MNARAPWYDPNIEKSRLLAALDQTRRYRCNSEELLACARKQRSYLLLQAIKEAIDDYAECEMGHREILLEPAAQRGMQAQMKRAMMAPSMNTAGDRGP